MKKTVKYLFLVFFVFVISCSGGSGNGNTTTESNMDGEPTEESNGMTTMDNTS